MIDHSESTTGTAKRQRAYAGRQRNSGRRRVNWWLDTAIIVEIDRRATAMSGAKTTALNAVLQALLAQTLPAPAVSTPKPAVVAPVAPVMLSTTETARRLAVTVPDLVKWRKEGRGPKARRVKNTWRYSEQEVAEWIKEGERIAEQF